MAQWVDVGRRLVNVEAMEYIEQITPSLVQIHMTSGIVIEITGNIAVNVWSLLIADRVPFLDSQFPTRDFSGL